MMLSESHPAAGATAFANQIPKLRARIDAALERRLETARGSPARLCDAMRYAVLGSGKRLRPLLVYASGASVNVAPDQLDSIAAAIECVHAYSLVHDDLPAMDDDELRRGRPTTHVKFDEATAILVGDVLQALAFEILASDRCWDNASHISCKLIDYLAKASGTSGMAGGQALDLAAAGQPITVEDLDRMYRLKTGRLIRAAVGMPLLCDPNVTERTRSAMDAFADRIGLAFQVKDDLLEIDGTTSLIGKPQDSDVKNAKSTYPGLIGGPAARQRIDALCREAMAQIEPLGAAAEPLGWLARYIVERET